MMMEIVVVAVVELEEEIAVVLEEVAVAADY